MTAEEKKIKQREWSKRWRSKNADRLVQERQSAEYKKYHRQYKKLWGMRNREKEAIRQREWRNRPENKQRILSMALKRNRGLSYEERDAELQKQGGVCAICKEIPETLHIDHCHRTGKRRAILCQFCNQGLGSFRENKQRLRNAIVYLIRHREEDVADIQVEDKLTFRTMEAEAYKIQLQFQNAQRSVEQAIQQLNSFIDTLYEKHEVSKKEYRFDPKTLTFEHVPQPEK